LEEVFLKIEEKGVDDEEEIRATLDKIREQSIKHKGSIQEADMEQYKEYSVADATETSFFD